MSILASLARAYDRLEGAPPFGYSSEKIGFLISLNDDGSVAHVVDLRGDDKKRSPRLVQVPQPVKKTSGIATNFLWDKTAYALGVTAGDGKRTAREHAAFVDRHREALAESDDRGLVALRRFLDTWQPEMFQPPLWPDEMKDRNVIFTLESDRLSSIYMHLRPAAKAVWTRYSSDAKRAGAVCLITGEIAPVARLHPSIKGVWGGQSSGGSIVSFNLNSFESYGHEQGDNAPVSEAATFAYTTALNIFLASGSRHRLQIGDASTVFWADASEASLAIDAEMLAMGMLSDNAINETMETARIADRLDRIRQGILMAEIDPRLADGVRFHVLGLAPNAARISIRFYFEDDFGKLAENYQRYVADMAISPPPRDPYPALWKYLSEVATLGKRENVPPNLAGDWMRSILTGTRYPMTLLATVLMRIRADGEVNAMRVSILRGLLIRNFGYTQKEAPVAFDPENTNKGYLLGRLFAVYENIQRAALGDKVNATIKDKFYGAASAQPRKVFGLLDKGSANHLSKVGKQSSIGRKVNLERDVASIMVLMSPGENPFPTSFSAEEQALFGLGYYHQRSEFFRPRPPATENSIDTTEGASQ
jgi:CRISPR-associated protein Csd1